MICAYSVHVIITVADDLVPNRHQVINNQHDKQAVALMSAKLWCATYRVTSHYISCVRENLTAHVSSFIIRGLNCLLTDVTFYVMVTFSHSTRWQPWEFWSPWLVLCGNYTRDAVSFWRYRRPRNIEFWTCYCWVHRLTIERTIDWPWELDKLPEVVRVIILFLNPRNNRVNPYGAEVGIFPGN